MLKKFLLDIPPVYESLELSRSGLLLKIRNYCQPDLIKPILDLISATINEDATFVQKPIDLRNQRTYAVKVRFLVLPNLKKGFELTSQSLESMASWTWLAKHTRKPLTISTSWCKT